MTEVTAPYNFVPLSDHVCGAEDLGLVIPPSQDQPQIGESGVLDIKLTCSEPLLVNWGPVRERDGRTDIKTIGLSPDGTPAIPGSSLRGMIRNVLEIASFGKMALVDDARTSVRDLNAKLDYTNRITTGDRTSGFHPLSKAGWLHMEKGVMRLTPCEFGRIDHSELSKMSETFKQGVCDCTPEDMAQARHVEQQFDAVNNVLERELWVQERSAKHEHSQPLWYRRVATNREDAEIRSDVAAVLKSGVLVFTGMPSRRKHMEFFFFDKQPEDAFDVPDEVFKAFRDVHERQEKISKTWEWRRQTLYAGKSIPVFYLTDNGDQITHLGLAMMFKIAADNSIGQMIDRTSRDHRSSKVDLAEAIFGRLESSKDKGDGWRGRVSFGWALAQEGTWCEPGGDKDVRVILAKPKPSFAPAYVRQRDFDSVDVRALLTVGEKYNRRTERTEPIRSDYRSYMDWRPANTKVTVGEEIRGWKRYPVGPDRNTYDPEPPAVGESVSCLRPLRPAQGQPITFCFRLRYHNLHKVELGALLWAMTSGGDENLRHALGMGRPLGWGQVKLSAQLDVAHASAMDAFTDAMEAWAKNVGIPSGWDGSVQVRQLKAMADPKKGEEQARLLAQMKIQIGGRNDFLESKKAGSVLPEFAVSDIFKEWDGPDPQQIKMSGNDQTAARQRANDLRRSIDEKRASRQKEEETTQKAQAGRAAAAQATDAFPIGSRVFVDNDPVDRVVKEFASNTFRIVSKRSDGSGRDKVNVKRLRPAR